MPLRLTVGALLLLLAVVVACPLEEPASACAPAPPHNKTVEIADESAIIVWDAASGIEHFIRRAEFKSDTDNFGFLVPTPTQPKLADASDEAFTVLAKVTEPKTIQKPRPSSGGGCGGCGGGTKSPGGNNAAPEVRVLDEQRVAGLDAKILEADSADALSGWLKEHQYDISPALTEWVEPYVKKGWKITAFKIARKEAGDTTVGTKALRMTFQTDKPFFPYREPPSKTPEGQAVPKRLLRVFFVGTNRVQGTLGETNEAWPGKTVWSRQLEGDTRGKLLELLKLPADTPPQTWWLTEFEDHSSPRPGTADVYFSASPNQDPIEREPNVQYVSNAWSGCVVCYAFAAYWMIACLVRHWPGRKGRLAT